MGRGGPWLCLHVCYLSCLLLPRSSLLLSRLLVASPLALATSGKLLCCNHASDFCLDRRRRTWRAEHMLCGKHCRARRQNGTSRRVSRPCEKKWGASGTSRSRARWGLLSYLDLLSTGSSWLRRHVGHSQHAGRPAPPKRDCCSGVRHGRRRELPRCTSGRKTARGLWRT